jgi:MoaA/NifB/PqqE/SkfB family radical SAM enzyme
MRYLHIGDQKKPVPRFPHHKDFVYKSYKYFNVKSILGYLTISGLSFVPRRIYYNLRNKCITPLILIIDPTSACNLSCKGCWAADYKKSSHISYKRLDELLAEAKKIGIKHIFMSGGEPLMRKDEILKLCRKHSKLTFGIFTNGTLIDRHFVDEMANLGNINVFLSIEGFRDETDMRRGQGTYDRIMAVIGLLKERDIGFAFSACYHSGNYKEVSGDRFLNFMREKGAWFGWMFNYLPIGKDADISLCCNSGQRAYVKQKVEEYSRRNNYNIIDFANSGHKSIGCVAAANDFAHINANGDLEPCAFFHYSDVNINEMSLVKALRSPFFKKIRSGKPFSKNLLRPCPIMDVPDALIAITKSSNVRSTHLKNPETAEELIAKTRPLAREWEPVANRLYDELPEREKRQFGILSKLVLWGEKQAFK